LPLFKRASYQHFSLRYKRKNHKYHCPNRKQINCGGCLSTDFFLVRNPQTLLAIIEAAQHGNKNYCGCKEPVACEKSKDRANCCMAHHVGPIVQAIKGNNIRSWRSPIETEKDTQRQKFSLKHEQQKRKREQYHEFDRDE
jgi:hypothetical protein